MQHAFRGGSLSSGPVPHKPASVSGSTSVSRIRVGPTGSVSAGAAVSAAFSRSPFGRVCELLPKGTVPGVIDAYNKAGSVRSEFENLGRASYDDNGINLY